MVADAHLDLAWNALDWNRDLMKPVADIRQFERQFVDAVPGDCTVSWPELRRGRVGLIIATLLPRLQRKEKPRTFFQSREAGYGACHGQLAYYRAMERRGVLRFLEDREMLQQHVQHWLQPDVGEQPLGIVLSMEGATAILEPEQVAEWYAAGLRIVGPAHYGPNQYCHGTGSEGGLTDQGRRLLREMERVGMLLDVTHLADQSFWEALDQYSGPVLASHHNCRALVPGDRQLADEQIQALAERGAVIGAALDCWMLQPGWQIGHSDPADVSLENVVDHIDHICQLLGTARHCGIGSDLDGGFGKEQTPHDLDTIADLVRIAEILDRRGYSASDIDGILYRNWVDFFTRAWG
ncbi:MAG TPA: peptidase M19 [Planctomycetaceae bacterium]|nr:peptidase M19 [Planctomycetaceae bacterium]